MMPQEIHFSKRNLVAWHIPKRHLDLKLGQNAESFLGLSFGPVQKSMRAPEGMLGPLNFSPKRSSHGDKIQGGPGCCVPYTSVVQHNSSTNGEALPVQGLL